MRYEDLLTHISKSGPCYRWAVTIIIAFASMKSGFNMFVLNLATTSVPHHCAQAIVGNQSVPLSEVLANGSIAGNFSAFDYTCTKPRFQLGSDDLLHVMNATTATGNDTATADQCSAWTFAPQPTERWTIITEYQIVCDRRYLADRLQTVLQIGICLSTLFGPLGDVIGRRWFFILFAYIDLACYIAMIFVNNLVVQMVLIFFVGFNAQAMLIGIILITELVSEDYRGVHGNLIWILYVLGYSGSSAISYFILNWRLQMVAVVIIISIGYASYIPLLPESPRWLLTRRKIRRAEQMLKQICKYSGCKEILDNFNCDSNEVVDESRDTSEESCVFKILPRENICRLEYFVTLGIVTFNLFTVSLVYFALSFERGFITKDPYLNVLISGLLELPAYISAWQLTNRVGRKYTTVSAMGFCGLGLLVLPYLPTNPDIAFQGSSVLAIAVKFSVTIAYSVLAVYGSEVLPTKVRSCSFFFACFLMGVGMMLAPELGGALSALYANLPYLLYGGISVIASLSLLLLPETSDKPMPNSVSEMEPVGCPCCPRRGGQRRRATEAAAAASGDADDIVDEELKALNT